MGLFLQCEGTQSYKADHLFSFRGGFIEKLITPFLLFLCKLVGPLGLLQTPPGPLQASPLREQIRLCPVQRGGTPGKGSDKSAFGRHKGCAFRERGVAPARHPGICAPLEYVVPLPPNLTSRE